MSGMIAMNTITELLKNTDKTDIMLVLGCDEKYNNGLASDFEWLTEWERILPLCVGTGVATLYEEELRLLGIPHGTVNELWRMGNARLTEQEWRFPRRDNKIDIEEFVTDFIADRADTTCDYTALFTTLKDRIKSEENKEIHVYFAFEQSDLPTVSSYHGKQAWNAIICGEKRNKETTTILCLQLLMELLIEMKKQTEQRLTLHVRGKGTASLLAYLSDHRMMPAQVRVGIRPDTPWAHTASLCRAHRGCPELWLEPADFGVDFDERLTRFFAQYPIGGVGFGGVLTESPLTEAAMRSLLRKHLKGLTARLAASDEALAQRLLEQFFSA